jgi:hypothetical protein
MKFVLASKDENFKGHYYDALEYFLGERVLFAPNQPVEVTLEAARFVIEKAPELRPADDEAERLYQGWLERRKEEMCAECFASSPYLRCGHPVSRQDANSSGVEKTLTTENTEDTENIKK